jgi:hypothetical protein
LHAWPVFESAQGRESGQRGQLWQPEVEQPGGENGQQGVGEWDLDPTERERQERLDDASVTERHGAARIRHRADSQ